MSGPSDRAVWADVLDELESTLHAVERLLDGEEPGDAVPAWMPPVTAGAMPTDLGPRARGLHRRQQELIARTVTATFGTRQKLGLLDRLTGLHAARRPDTAAYVDLKA